MEHTKEVEVMRWVDCLNCRTTGWTRAGSVWAEGNTPGRIVDNMNFGTPQGWQESSPKTVVWVWCQLSFKTED